MTVEELINKLKEFPPDVEVRKYNEMYGSSSLPFSLDKINTVNRKSYYTKTKSYVVIR